MDFLQGEFEKLVTYKWTYHQMDEEIFCQIVGRWIFDVPTYETCILFNFLLCANIQIYVRPKSLDPFYIVICYKK